MKKFEELKNLAEKAPTVVYDMETESGRFYNAANPQTILALLADRDQLKQCLRVIAVAHEFERGSCMKANVAHKARYALKKSDDVEKIKEIVE